MYFWYIICFENYSFAWNCIKIWYFQTKICKIMREELESGLTNHTLHCDLLCLKNGSTIYRICQLMRDQLVRSSANHIILLIIGYWWFESCHNKDKALHYVLFSDAAMLVKWTWTWQSITCNNFESNWACQLWQSIV